MQEPRRVLSSADDGIKSICFFRGHVPRKKHCSACKRASRGPKQSPAKRVCLGEEGQGSGAMPGRQARMSGVDFAPTKCDAVGCNSSSTCLHVRESLSTKSTGSLKNASIFSKRCSLLRRTSSKPQIRPLCWAYLGPRLARLQSEKCFSRGTCPRKKQIGLDSVVCGRQNSARLLHKI